MTRLAVQKTYKLYLGGAFPRSESGRTYEAEGHNVARASRKDARATPPSRAAPRAFPAWSGMTAYNRGQVLYRLAEMMGLAPPTSRAPAAPARRSKPRSIAPSGTRAGPTSSRRCSAGRTRWPARTSTSRFPSRRVSSRYSPRRSRRSSVSSHACCPRWSVETRSSLLRPRHIRWPVELAEALATSDFPAGAVNVLTGFQDELAPWLAGHMDVNAIDLTGIDGPTVELERAAAENVKRVIRSDVSTQSPWEIDRLPGNEDRLAPDRGLAPRRVHGLAEGPLRSASTRAPRPQAAPARVVHRDVVTEHAARCRSRHRRKRGRSERRRGALQSAAARRRLDELGVDAARAVAEVRDRHSAGRRVDAIAGSTASRLRVRTLGADQTAPSGEVATKTAFPGPPGSQECQAAHNAPDVSDSAEGSGNARKPRIAHEVSTSAIRTGGPMSPRRRSSATRRSRMFPSPRGRRPRAHPSDGSPGRRRPPVWLRCRPAQRSARRRRTR